MEHRGGCDTLQEVCPVLARKRVVQEMVKKEVGEQDYPAAIALMKQGTLEGDLGAKIHDLLSDAIRNDADVVWDGVMPGSEENYPIRVNAYCGVYWIWAMEYDPVGYFTDKRYAISYARSF